MKRWIFSLLIGAAAGAGAQSAGDAALAGGDREREKLNAVRLAQEAAFDAQEAACYKKFFVNNCLIEVKSHRREAMAELKRQEVALNDEKRRIKAAEQITSIEQKSSPEVQQQAAERRVKSLEDERARLERSRKKAEERGEMKQGEAQNAATTAGKLKGSQERAQVRVDKQAAIAQEVEKYKDKQEEVRERKASREKKQREQTKPPAAPLPTPG